MLKTIIFKKESIILGLLIIKIIERKRVEKVKETYLIFQGEHPYWTREITCLMRYFEKIIHLLVLSNLHGLSKRKTYFVSTRINS